MSIVWRDGLSLAASIVALWRSRNSGFTNFISTRPFSGYPLLLGAFKLLQSRLAAGVAAGGVAEHDDHEAIGFCTGRSRNWLGGKPAEAWPHRLSLAAGSRNPRVVLLAEDS
jgi:hypothetical protein